MTAISKQNVIRMLQLVCITSSLSSAQMLCLVTGHTLLHVVFCMTALQDYKYLNFREDCMSHK